MAGLNGTITVSNAEYRPCYIRHNGGDMEKALFHRWGEVFGEHKQTFAIVETEDGNIHEVLPIRIRFVDNQFAEIAFPPEGSKNGQ